MGNEFLFRDMVSVEALRVCQVAIEFAALFRPANPYFVDAVGTFRLQAAATSVAEALLHRVKLLWTCERSQGTLV